MLATLTKKPVASFQAPPEPPIKLPNDRHLVDFRYIAESNVLVIVLAGGDIVIVNLDEDLLPDQEKVGSSDNDCVKPKKVLTDAPR